MRLTAGFRMIFIHSFILITRFIIVGTISPADPLEIYSVINTDVLQISRK